MKATALAHPNIALIKYWGKRDVAKNLPVVPSLSLTLSDFFTQTTVTWGHHRDCFQLNGTEDQSKGAKKVFQFLDLIDSNRPHCLVASENNFPTAAGLASSASAFAALALAGTKAASKEFSDIELSVLARQGSGSACRSIWGGWVGWHKGRNEDGSDSHGYPIAGADFWDIRMVVAVVSDKKKPIGSREAMNITAKTSPYFDSWCRTANHDLQVAKSALLAKDINTLGQQMEHSTMKMFGTMFTAIPSIRYWKASTLTILDQVQQLREQGISCWATMDAGPNVKILCLAKDAAQIENTITPLCLDTHILKAGSHAQYI